MRILMVAATPFEVAPLISRFSRESRFEKEKAAGQRLHGYAFANHDVHVLISGVGMVATAAWCARELSERSYDLALNVGICGSFDRAIGLGRVVHVVSDRIAELGAEDDEKFLSLGELGMSGAWLDSSQELINASPPNSAFLKDLPVVSGITVNTVHGNERSIAATLKRYKPQVESMEGAAFMYACTIHGVAFAQVRSVSNFVERRNRDGWQMQEAIASLGTAAVGILETL